MISSDGATALCERRGEHRQRLDAADRRGRDRRPGAGVHRQRGAEARPRRGAADRRRARGLAAAMEGQPFEHLFADLIDREPQLPEFLAASAQRSSKQHDIPQRHAASRRAAYDYCHDSRPAIDLFKTCKPCFHLVLPKSWSAAKRVNYQPTCVHLAQISRLACGLLKIDRQQLATGPSMASRRQNQRQKPKAISAGGQRWARRSMAICCAAIRRRPSTPTASMRS